MDRLDVSYQTFTRHFRAAPFATQAKSFVALELGPSGSLLTAPIASAFGAAEVVLVDLTHAPSQDSRHLPKGGPIPGRPGTRR